MAISAVKPPLGSRVDWGHPLANGLVGCWLFNENGGGLVYDLASDNVGTFSTNGSTYPSWHTRPGIKMDRTDGGHIRLATSVRRLPTVAPVTFMTVVYPYTFLNATAQSCISYSQGSVINNYYSVGFSNATASHLRPRWQVRDASNSLIIDGADFIETHIKGVITGVTYGAADHRCFYNGLQVATSTTSTSPASLDSFNFGVIKRSNAWTTDHADGVIEANFVWARALNPTEVRQMADNPYGFIIRRNAYVLSTASTDVTVALEVQSLVVSQPAISVSGDATLSLGVLSSTVSIPTVTLPNVVLLLSAIDATITPYGSNGLDENTKLLVHFNGTDGATTTRDETNRHLPSTFTFAGAAQISTSQYQFGGASLSLGSGTNNYVSLPDSADWNLVTSNTDNWTLDLFVRFNSGTFSVAHGIIGHGNNATHWRLEYQSDGGFGFTFVVTVSSTIVTYLNGAGGASAISDTNQHHVAVIKIANEYGLYLDGVQKAYVLSNAITSDLEQTLTIGRSTEQTSTYHAGFIDELRINNSNYFFASPNSGLTDVIPVPIREYERFVLTDAVISLDALSISVTQPSLTVDTGGGNVTVALGVQTLVVTTQALSISTDNVIGLAVQTLTINQQTLSVLLDTVISLSVQTAVVNLQSLTVQTDGNVTIAVDVISLVVNLVAPLVSLGTTISLNSNDLVVSIPSVTVSIEESNDFGVQTLTVNLPSVSVLVDRVISLGVLSAVVSLPDVTVELDGNVTINVAVQTLTANLINLSLLLDNVIALGVLSPIVSLPSFSVSTGTTLDLGILTITVNLNSPSVLVGDVLVELNSVTLTVSLYSPDLVLVRQVTVQPNALLLAINLLGITVDTQIEQFILRILRTRFENYLDLQTRFDANLTSRTKFENQVNLRMKTQEGVDLKTRISSYLENRTSIIGSNYD